MLNDGLADARSKQTSRPWWMEPEVLDDGLRHKFTCPLPGYPGHVILPAYLSGQQFYDWWLLVNKPDQMVNAPPSDAGSADKRPDMLQLWEQRRPFIVDCQIANVTTEQLDPSGLKLPAAQLATWYAAITQPLVMRATSLPNWPRPSTNGRQETAEDEAPAATTLAPAP